MPSSADARALAEAMLAEPLPDRWRHVQAVAREELRLAELLDVDGDALTQAAVLQDIGRSPALARVGFHPSTERFLAARGYDGRVAALVAHHCAASVEAALRGVEGLGRVAAAGLTDA